MPLPLPEPRSRFKLEEKLEKLQKSSEESHKELETLTTEKAQTEAAIAEASVKVSALEAASLKVEGLWDANEKLRYLKEEVRPEKFISLAWCVWTLLATNFIKTCIPF